MAVKSWVGTLESHAISTNTFSYGRIFNERIYSPCRRKAEPNLTHVLDYFDYSEGNGQLWDIDRFKGLRSIGGDERPALVIIGDSTSEITHALASVGNMYNIVTSKFEYLFFHQAKIESGSIFKKNVRFMMLFPGPIGDREFANSIDECIPGNPPNRVQLKRLALVWNERTHKKKR